MSVSVVIPVKSLDEAKSRLSPILGSKERRLLCNKMFLHVLKASDCPQVRERIVITRDSYIRKLALGQGAFSVREEGMGLNKALVQVTQYLLKEGTSSVLILPADLPFIQTRDIETILNLGNQEKSIIISPCRRGNGTNALLIKPPGLIEYCFGDKSFIRHQELAFQCGVIPIIYRSHGTGFDLDFPEDFQIFLKDKTLHETDQYFSSSKFSYNRARQRPGGHYN